MSKVRTRFAPSPTGFLHIGGARTTLFNWLYARHNKGTFVLRIEDTDEVRSTEDSVTAILDSIAWLGMNWDEGPVDLKTDKGPHAPYYQMRRVPLYKKHLESLLESGKAYPCYCTKEELEKMRQLAQLEKRPPKYDGRCRNLSAEQRKLKEQEGRKFSVRFKFPEDGVTVVNDIVRGDVSFENKLQQDFVIWKTTGGPTYNFAVVIDDHEMEITHVTRGDEHLSNTPSQLQIYRALGWEPPKFAHLSMIMGPDGSKLSKRHGATSVLEYKQLGFLPEAMRNYLALLGWSTSDSQQLFEKDQLIERFDLAGCQSSPAMFDQVKLTWMNGEYMRKLSVPELIERAKPFLEAAGLYPPPAGPDLEKVVSLEREKYKLLAEIPALIEFFYKPVEYTPKAKQKAAEGREIVVDMAEAFAALPAYDEKSIEACIRQYCESKGMKAGQAIHPIRAAVTGRTEGPTLFLMLEVMGRDTVVKRLRDAAALAAI